MKKIGLILATAAMAMGFIANAASPKAAQLKGELKPEAKAMLKSMVNNAPVMTQKFEEVNDDFTRSWTDDKTGYMYIAHINPQGLAVDLFQWQQPVTFEDYPFYWAMCMIIQYDKDGNPLSQCNTMINWPCYLYWGNAKSNGDLDITEEELPAGKTALDMVTLQEVCNTPNRVHTWKSLCEVLPYGEVIAPAGNPNGIQGIVNYSILDGACFIMQGNSYIQGDMSQTSVCNYSFNGYKALAAPVCQFSTVQNFTYKANGIDRNYTINVNYDGTGNFMGWEKTDIELPLVNQPHIFYMGVVEDEKTDQNIPMYEEKYGPLHKFRLYVPVGQYIQMMVADTAKEFDQNKGYRDGGQGFMYVAETPDDYDMAANWIWWQGDYFLAENADPNHPQAIANMIIPDMYLDKEFGWLCMSVPVDCGMMPYGVTNSNFNSDAMRFVYQENNIQMVHPTQFGICTPDGFYINGNDEYGNKWTTNKYTGKVIYHYNPKNVQEIVELDAICPNPQDAVEELLGSIEKTNVFAANGEIVISADEAAKATVYALNGAVVAEKNVAAGEVAKVAADKGIYLVKVGNNVTKVVL